MNRIHPFSTKAPRTGCWRSGVLLSLLFNWNAALAGLQDISVSPCNNVNTSYALSTGQAVPLNSDPFISVVGASGNVFFEASTVGGNIGCSGGPEVWTCAGLTVTVPKLDAEVPSSTKVTVTGTASGTLFAEGNLDLKVTDAADTSKVCIGKYKFHVTAKGGGWGDPHITTVDGVHFDFQGAGEFTALRESGLEIQTRQTPVPTASIPVSNTYTGLATCVAIYTAVAARIGQDRVTLQPNISGEPDPSGMQLRVNGRVIDGTAAGMNLPSGGHVSKQADGTYEITDANGTQLVVASAYWDSQKLWYLNINVNQTSAFQGTLGRIAQGSWLPALPDGTSLGPKPTSAAQRYTDLYQKFTDAWRVTDATSLFDYKPGTNTASFTMADWPRNNPQSCAIPGQTSAQPETLAAAQQACSGVNDPVQKADCIFDVTYTGHTGFGASYEKMQKYRPRPPGWHGPPGKDTTEPGPTKPGPWWWWIVLVLLALLAV
jgi:hypothetical protein